MCDTKDTKTNKLIFKGCCNLSNDDLAKTHKLDLITDAELNSIGLKRNSLIDDYRHLDEMTTLREFPHLASTRNLRTFISKLRKPKFKSPRKASKVFNYDLLNKFFICMQSESENFCRFMLRDMKIASHYLTNSKVLLMSETDRVFSRYESYFNIMDKMYVNGERDKVLELVAKAMVHFHRDANSVKVLPNFGSGYGPHYARQRHSWNAPKTPIGSNF